MAAPYSRSYKPATSHLWSAGTPDGRPICFAYNSPYKKCAGQCGRVHGCRRCLGEHPVHMGPMERESRRPGGADGGGAWGEDGKGGGGGGGGPSKGKDSKGKSKDGKGGGGGGAEDRPVIPRGGWGRGGGW